jgi:acetyltransferase-like isoleucine patch superfamily enzyme
LQHVVETVVGRGVREIDFVVPEATWQGRKTLGDGTRWGARFRYYSAEGKPIYDAFALIPSRNPHELLLLAHSDCLPLIQSNTNTCAPTLFCLMEGTPSWTGWGLIRGADILRFPQGMEQKSDLFTFLLEECAAAICHGPRPLSARSYEDLIEANRRVLAREFPELLMGGTEVQPGVWVARNVSIHPTAKLSAPAFLGENSRVAAGVQVGPAASIGRDCMIERETLVSDSVVYSGSYVGQKLALRGVVVDRSRLVNTRWDAEIEGVDDLLLGSVFGTPLHTHIRRGCLRVAAAVAMVVTFPCLLLLYAGSALRLIPALQRQAMVRTPTVSAPYRWETFSLWSFGTAQVPAGRMGWVRHFLFCFLPALPSIVAGHLGLAGMRPQTRDEVEAAGPAERTIYLRKRLGILQPWLMRNREAEDNQPKLAARDTGWRGTIRVVTLYTGLVLRSLFSNRMSVKDPRYPA